MITLTKLDAKLLELDPDQIERVDATPGTVLTMRNGTKHLVEEELSEVIERVRQSRASLLAEARPFARRSEAPVAELGVLPRKKGRRS
jgi:flagellar protein FlbD